MTKVRTEDLEEITSKLRLLHSLETLPKMFLAKLLIRMMVNTSSSIKLMKNVRLKSTSSLRMTRERWFPSEDHLTSQASLESHKPASTTSLVLPWESILLMNSKPFTPSYLKPLKVLQPKKRTFRMSRLSSQSRTASTVFSTLMMKSYSD